MNGIASATQFAHSCSLNTFSLLVEASVGTNPGRHTHNINHKEEFTLL